MKVFRSILSVLLVICLVLPMTVSAYAAPDSREPAEVRRVHDDIVVDTDPAGGYKGDYVVIYNPSTLVTKSCSTGDMSGLIETDIKPVILPSPGVTGVEDDDLPFYTIDVDAQMQELAKTEEPRPAPKDVRKSYAAGDTKTFSISTKYSPTGDSSMEFKCLYVGSHCYIWTPTSSANDTYPLDTIDTSYARLAAIEFDSKYDTMRASFGNHTNGSSGDGKIHILYYNISSSSSSSGAFVAGFFSSSDITNNGLPMLNIDTYPGVYYVKADGTEYKSMDKTYNTMVHEFQHLINHSNTSGMSSWLNECFSAAAEEICYPGSSVISRIQSWENYYYETNDDWLSPPNEFRYKSSFNLHKGYSMYNWNNDLSDVLALYAQVSFFSQYLYTRFGNTIYRQISNKYSSGEAAAITAATGVDCSELVEDFRVAVTANAAQDQYGGIYGFKAQPGYDPSKYHDVQDPWSLLAPVVFTGSSCSIKGGGAITVKPLNGVYYPPSGASSDLKYIGISVRGSTAWPIAGVVRIPVRAYEDSVLTAKLTGAAAKLSSDVVRFQWQRKVSGGWSSISGATGETYKVKSGDTGRYIRVVVTADGYSGSLISGECECSDSIPLTEAYFPDPYLRQYLSDKFDTDGSGFLEYGEISKIHELHMNVDGENYHGVASLEGVRYLCELQDIYANHTQITSFDGTGLEYLYTLDLSECPLDSLELSQNDQLRKLYLSDLTGSLDHLDLSGLRNLMLLKSYGSHFAYLDISKNPYLVDAALYGEEITYNGFKTFKIDRYNYLSIDCYDYHVTVAHFDEAFPSTRLRSWFQDDRNFNWDGNNDLSIAEARNVKNMDVGDWQEEITDLTGVELLPNLEYLAAFNCEVGEVDLSRNTKLNALDLDNCQLNSLDVSSNTALQWIYCYRNGMGQLTLGSNDVLYQVLAFENYLMELDVSGLPALCELDLNMNLLWELDVTKNPALEHLFVSNNCLSELDVSNNKNLKKLNCYGNSISVLDISACPKLVSAYNGTRDEGTDSDTGVPFWRYKDDSGNELFVDKDTKIIAGKPTITTQPKSQTAAADTTVKFKVKANGATSYQWYYRTSSTGSWKKSSLTGSKTATLSVKATEARNGYQYRCKVSNAGGYKYSNAATLTVVTKPTITTQPASKTAYVGTTAKFTVKAGGEDLTYQWYYRTSSTGTWTKTALTGNKTATLSVKATEARNGYQYRCKVSNAAGYVYTKAVTLTVSVKPVITTQPKSKTASAGDTVKFTVKADGATSYQWYYRTGSTGEWKKCTGTGYNTATLTVKAASYRNGYQYRCKVSNAKGYKYTSTVTLTVK